jgi:GNAT superfamily N-acetyltransferase
VPAAPRIREARPGDVERIFGWIVDLATYERAAEQVIGTPELLADALFGNRPSAEAVLAELDGEPAGFALFYATFSTWTCRRGIWLEDLYVPPDRRRFGVARALLAHLARITIERGGSRLEWAALEWNEPALAFYRTLGATHLNEWQVHRVDGPALAGLAAG